MKKLAFIKRSSGHHWVGNGFPVRGIFSYQDIAKQMSPFLLMDYAGPVEFAPTTKKLGVGQHPHRGFETVTIVYSGGVSHKDSAGGGGTIGPGDVQWMTAGSGILHEEFHSDEFARTGGAFEMIQLWVNLPAKDKMTSPAYQEITQSQIARVALKDNAGEVRVIAGNYNGSAGAANTFTAMNVWDIKVTAGKLVAFAIPAGYTTALFILKGEIMLDNQQVSPAELAVLARAGETLEFAALADTRLLLLSGEPIDEPIVGHGPFVMNSQDEIVSAIQDYKKGQFGRDLV